MSIATHEPLFLREYTVHDLFEGEKRASLVKMPDDEKKWPPFILSSLQREFPFLAEYDLEIVLDRVEPEAGAALGYVQVRNRTRARPQDVGAFGNIIRIPIIIQDRRLQKFLVFETGGQTYPMTEERVKQAMIDPGIFDTTVGKTPGSPSIVDQLFPPYQQRQGFGRVVEPAAGGISKVSAAPLEDGGHTTKTASSSIRARLRLVAR